MGFSKKDLCKPVIKHIDRLRTLNPSVDACLSRVESVGSLLLFGGAVRDIIAHRTPRDYDIVVVGDDDALRSALSGRKPAVNRFGGFRLTADGYKFDIWSLESTWAFREGLLTASVQNLSKSVFLSIDSVLVDLTNSESLAQEFYRTMSTGVLDIVLEENPFPTLCVLRALMFVRSDRFRLSSRLETYVKHWAKCSMDPLQELRLVQSQHYGPLVLPLEAEVVGF